MKKLIQVTMLVVFLLSCPLLAGDQKGGGKSEVPPQTGKSGEIDWDHPYYEGAGYPDKGCEPQPAGSKRVPFTVSKYLPHYVEPGRLPRRRRPNWIVSKDDDRLVGELAAKVDWKKSRVYELTLTAYTLTTNRVAWVVQLEDKYLVRVMFEMENCWRDRDEASKLGRILLVLPRDGPDKVEVSTCYVLMKCKHRGNKRN